MQRSTYFVKTGLYWKKSSSKCSSEVIWEFFLILCKQLVLCGEKCILDQRIFKCPFKVNYVHNNKTKCLQRVCWILLGSIEIIVSCNTCPSVNFPLLPKNRKLLCLLILTCWNHPFFDISSRLYPPTTSPYTMQCRGILATYSPKWWIQTLKEARNGVLCKEQYVKCS